MAQVKTAEFKKISKQAIKNEKLQHSLDHVMEHFVSARSSIIDQDIGAENWELLRTRAASIKQSTIENLDYYLDLVDKNVRRNGGYVHFANDANEANQIVLDIAKRNEVKTVIKDSEGLNFTAVAVGLLKCPQHLK